MTTIAASSDIIPHSRPFLGREEIEAVNRVIQSRHIAQGAEVEQLEREWADATGNRGAVCVGSGLAALRLALHALGAGPGSEVIVPAYSCIAILNAVLALGGTPVLADVEVDRWTLDPESVRKFRTRRTAAGVAVHLFGMPIRVDAIRGVGVPILEDCAHGIGGRVNGKPFGGAATASIASFYATKMIAGGEGGVVASSDEQLLAVVRNARNPSDQKPSAIHLNDKLTDLEAAIVRVQLGRLQWTLGERARRAARYAELLSALADRELLVLPGPGDGRIWYRYAVRLTSRLAADVVRELYASGVHADQPVWDLRGVVGWSQEFRGADIAFDRLLSLPLYPDLSPLEQERVCEALFKVLAREKRT
jgi:perosamine synthetase